MNYFPNNKISHFSTRLPQPIDLNGEWEVGLSEIIYPHMWNNVVESRNVYEYDNGDGILKKAKIPCGFYETPSDIIKIMKSQNFRENINLTYNKHTKKVKIVLHNGARLILPAGLAELLGFNPGEISDITSSAPVQFFESPYVADPNYDFRLMYIYADIVEPGMVGDVFAPLLRVITVKGQDGEMILKIFDQAHYVPVTRKNFQTIEVIIRTHTGRLLSFARGKLIVKLHFRQKYIA